MKRTLKSALAGILVIVMVLAMASCSVESILSGAVKGNFKGKPDRRFTGTWILENPEDVNAAFGGTIKFTNDGTIEYSFSGSVAIPAGTEENSTETAAEINLDEVGQMFDAVYNLVTMTYEVIDDKTVKTGIHSNLTDEVDESIIEYAFEGDILIFDGSRYKKS